LKELVVCALERWYRVLILPKYRKKVFLVKARKWIAEILQDVWKQRGIERIEGNVTPESMCMRLSDEFEDRLRPRRCFAVVCGYGTPQ